MPDAISKSMKFKERGSAVAAAPSRKGRWWMAAVLVVVLAVGAVTAYWYLSLCRNCSPILCDDPCTLPTFGQVHVLPGTDA